MMTRSFHFPTFPYSNNLSMKVGKCSWEFCTIYRENANHVTFLGYVLYGHLMVNFTNAYGEDLINVFTICIHINTTKHFAYNTYRYGIHSIKFTYKKKTENFSKEFP